MIEADMHTPRSSLRRKYLYLLTSVTGVLFVIYGAFEMTFAFRENRVRMGEIQNATAKVVASRVENFLGAIQGQVEEIANLPWASGLLGEEERRDEYQRLMKRIPAVHEVRLLDSNGRQILLVSRIVADQIGGHTKTELSSALSPSSSRLVGNAYFLESGGPYVSLVVPDRGAGGRATQVEFHLGFVMDLVASEKIGARGNAYVVDAANQLIAHPNPSMILRKTDLTSYAPVQKVREWEKISARKDGANGNVASLGLIESAGIDNKERALISARSITNTGWWVFIEQPYVEVLAPVFATLYRAALFLAIGVVAAVIVSYLMARKFSQPILLLKEGASRIGAGDLGARLKMKSNDELSDLANEFNKMADQLQSYTTSLEQKVSEKTAQLELANRHKSEFLANMSHELRTPLNAVIGFSDVLSEQYFGELNAKQKEYVKDIHESGQHLLLLINDILDLSKIEAGKMDLELARFHLPTAIDNALVLVRERALRRQLQLKASIAADIGDVIADERKFKQILINLLTNAVKFSYPNGWVEVIVVRGTNETMITVKDTGPGIAKEDQAAIFEEFHQLKPSGSAKQEGTGLGLSLARRFTELHGGRIWVESEVGAGSAFTFSLPDRELVAV